MRLLTFAVLCSIAAAYLDVLNPGELLHRGGKITSPSGRFHLDLQNDGNLVLYRTDDNKPIWHTDTWARILGSHYGGITATMQTDGNFVVMARMYLFGSLESIWDSKTGGRGENYLRVQDDGNLVIYAKGTTDVRWASNTDWARPGKTTNLRLGSLDAPHVANNSAMTMQGAVPDTLTEIAHLDEDAVSADGVGTGVGVGVGVSAPDLASDATADGTI